MADFDPNKINENLRKRAQALAPDASPVRQFDRPLWKQNEQYRQWQQDVDASTQAQRAAWDYQNVEKRGMNQEKLPYGAVAWKPNGSAYYGDGIKGWWNEMSSKLVAPYESRPDEIVAKKPMGAVGVPGGLGKKPAIPTDKEVLDLGQTLSNFWNSIAQTETPVGRAARGVQLGVGIIPTGLAESAKKLEQGFGMLQATGDEYRRNQIAKGEIYTSTGELIRKGDPQWEKYFKFYAPPPRISEAHWFGDKGILDSGYQAGRMFYSGVLTPLAREEYLRRYQAGENPYLLAEELQNPLAELVGQLVFDPLNFIGPISRSFFDLRELNGVRKALTVLPDEYGKFLEVGEAISDASAIERLQDVVEVQKTTAARITQGVTDLMGPLGGKSLRTAAAKVFAQDKESTIVLSWLVNSATNNPDDAADVIEAGIKLVGEDADEIADAFTIIKNKVIAPKPLLSETGQRTFVVMRNMLKDENGAVDAKKFLEGVRTAAKKGDVALTEFALGKLKAGIENLYPSVGEMEKASKAFRAGTDKSIRAQRLATAYDRLSPSMKALAGVGERMAKLYKGPNTFFANVYMGYNPGYVIRNWLSNSFHIALDQGISAVLQSPTKAREEIKAILGYAHPAVGGFGGGTLGVETIDTGLMGALKKKNLLAVANWVEDADSAKVVAKSLKNSMGRLVQEGMALPNTRGMLDAGLSDTAIRRFVNLIHESRYSVDKALDIMLGEVKAGFINVTPAEYLSQDLMTKAKAFNLDDDIAEYALSSNSIDEFNAKLDARIKGFDDEAKLAANDLPAIAPESEAAEHLGQMIADPDIPDELKAIGTNAINQNQITKNVIEQAIGKTLDGMAIEARSDPDALRAVQKLRDMFAETGNASAKLADEATRVGTTLHVRHDQWVVNKDTLDIKKIWEGFGVGGDVPADWNEFNSRFWLEYYFPKIHEYHIERRNLLSAALEKVDQLSGGNPMLARARDEIKLAVEYDKNLDRYRQIERPLALAIERGQTDKAAFLIARSFGEDFVDETGKMNYAHLKDAINEQLPEGQKISRLEDITDIEVIKEALAKRFRVKVLGETAQAGAEVAPQAAKAITPTKPSTIYLADLGKRGGAPEGYARLYRAVSPEEFDLWNTSRKLDLTTGEKWFTTDATYIERVKGNIPKGKQAFKDREIGGVIEIDVPATFFEKNLAKKGDPNLPQQFKNLPSFKSGQANLVQVKHEKGAINLGFFSQENLDELVDVSRVTEVAPQAAKVAESVPEIDTDLLGKWLLDRVEAPKEPIGDLVFRVTRDSEWNGIQNGEMSGEFWSSDPTEYGRHLTNGDDMVLLVSRKRGAIAERGMQGLPTSSKHYQNLDGKELDDIVAVYKWKGDSIAGKPIGVYKKSIVPKVANVMESAPLPVPLLDSTPSPAQAARGNLAGVMDMAEQIKAQVAANWGRLEPVRSGRALEGAIRGWAKGAKAGVAEAKILAAQVADADRTFTLLSYADKTYKDVALGFLYPYSFWYTHTYANWIKRIARNPEVIAAYAKYKEYMGKIHAGAPEWYKYNVKVSGLLGYQFDSPMYFNLESTLNPLNGLTGVDFNDQNKRVNWWTKTLDDMNKLGPSTFTPISLLTAYGLKLQGQEDAASRWGGRLFPQTAALKSVLSLMNVNIPTQQGINEFDPAVSFFSNGMDSYERARVGRAIAQMETEGLITHEEGIDAGNTQSGPIWEEAAKRAINSRAGGQLASFFLGTGFKARSESDIEIDQMYSDQRRLWNGRDTMSPEEYKHQQALLRDKYPFMDTVILSRKGGFERDAAYSYNVLSRIPPGQRDDLAKMVGIDYSLIQKFYDDKGNFEKWQDSDYKRFTAAMSDIGAVLSLPDLATREDWNAATTAYGDLMEQGKARWGADIWDKETAYYSNDDRDAANAYLEQHPELVEAMDWKQMSILNDQRATPYYTTIDRIQKFYNRQMYKLIFDELGDDIMDKWQYYSDAKLTNEGRQYWKEHPELQKYMTLKDTYNSLFASAVARISTYLKEPTYPPLRTQEGTTQAQTNLIDYMNNADAQPTVYDYTYEDWQAKMSAPLERLVRDYVLRGEKLSSAATDQLEYIANKEGIDEQLMLELIEQSMNQP